MTLYMKQKIFSWSDRFTIKDELGSDRYFVEGSLAVEVKKELAFFVPKYTLEGTDWTVEGDFWDHNYEIAGPSGRVASINKAYFTWGDSYQIDIAGGADELLVLATVLAIDCVIDDSSNH